MALAAGKSLNGKVIDGYEVIDVLQNLPGRIAYRVKNLELNRFEQLELLPQSLAEDEERSERFLREIRLLSSLEHPNIVTCYGAARMEGQLAMMVELLEGVTLGDRLELGPMEPVEALLVMRQLLSAAQAIHTRGVIHREISPANIIITPDKVVKLSGFTFAKTAHDFGLTRAGTIFGDLNYSSPEQISGEQPLDSRTDIYSLGAVLFALLAGRPPFEGKSQFDVMLAHVERQPEAPSAIRPGLPPELDAIVLKALAKRPDDRYSSAEEVLAAIDQVKLGALPAAEPEPPQLNLGVDPAWASALTEREPLGAHKRDAAQPPPAPRARRAPEPELPESTRSTRFAWIFLTSMMALILLLTGLALHSNP
jgi:serine/threonine-protein kinase